MCRLDNLSDILHENRKVLFQCLFLKCALNGMGSVVLNTAGFMGFGLVLQSLSFSFVLLLGLEISRQP